MTKKEKTLSDLATPKSVAKEAGPSPEVAAPVAPKPQVKDVPAKPKTLRKTFVSGKYTYEREVKA